MNWRGSSLALMFTLALGACAWVPLTSEGEKARVMSEGEVGSCTKVGKNVASVKAKIWIFSRNAQKVQSELEALARNQAAEMGGDTVVPISEVEDGKQTFAVYRCVN